MKLRRTPISRGSLFLLILAVAVLIIMLKFLLYPIINQVLLWIFVVLELGLVALLLFGKTQSGSDLTELETADQHVREQRSIARFMASGFGLFFVGVLLVEAFRYNAWSQPFYIYSLLAACVLALLPLALRFVNRP